MCFMDLNYDRASDSMLEKERDFFQKLKISFIDGMDMLIAQAILAQILWNKLKLKSSDIRNMVTKIKSNLDELRLCQN